MKLKSKLSFIKKPVWVLNETLARGTDNLDQDISINYNDGSLEGGVDGNLNNGSATNYANIKLVSKVISDLMDLLEDNGISDDPSSIIPKGLTYDPNPTFDSSVTHGMLVYRGADGKYYPALADGSEKSQVVGYADLENNRMIVSGLIKTNYSFASGEELYLSDTEEGKIITDKTLVKVGVSLGNGYIILGSSVSGGSVGDISNLVTFEDLEYYSLLLSTPFQDVYYDKLLEDSLHIVSGSANHNRYDSKYIIQSGTTLETDDLLNLSENDYRFFVHLNSSVTPNIEYSVDGGTTWSTCEPDKIITVSAGFKKIRFRFTFNSDAELNSFGVLYHYKIPGGAYFSDTRMFEILNIEEDKPEGTIITLPNGATYTPDSKSLEVYLNRVRLIPNVDYEEVDSMSVKFKLPLHAGDTIVFTEKFGYVDVSEDNNTKLQSLVPSWTSNHADYIILRDQSTGKLYKLYIDNDNLKFEPIS